MKITFKRNPDLEDEDIAAAWVGYIDDQPLALVVFEWSVELQQRVNTRYSVSYNENDVALAAFIDHITRRVYARLRASGDLDELEINLPGVKYEAA